MVEVREVPSLVAEVFKTPKLRFTSKILFILLLSPFLQGWALNPRKEEARLRSEIIFEARQQLGKPYKWNRSGPNAFDCSGFVYYVLKKILGANRFSLPYSLANVAGGYSSQSLYYRDQLNASGAMIDCSWAKEGDIVFFHKPAKAAGNSHIGFIANAPQRTFITAQSPETGVAEHAFSQNSYWGKRRFECFRNIWLTED